MARGTECVNSLSNHMVPHPMYNEDSIDQIMFEQWKLKGEQTFHLSRTVLDRLQMFAS